MHFDPHSHDPFGDGAPLDPFLDSDDDPAQVLDSDDEAEPLDETEEQLIREDLADLAVFQQVLAPCSIKGIVVDCDGCGETHYFAWEIMRANLNHMIQFGLSRVHEPPFEPKPNEFVSWDYARGFTDAVTSASPTGHQ